MFKLYDCKLRIGGSVLNEVRKDQITASEIEVYRVLHGSDAVLDIKEAGEVKRTDREERARLEELFANPATAMGESLAKKKRMLSDLFGHERLPLPKELDLSPAQPEDDEDAGEETVAPASAKVAPSRTRVEPSFAE